MFRKPHHIIALGGTFDHFHVGHEHFLTFASQMANHLIIGVTNTDMSRHKLLPHLIQPLHKRMSSITNFCRKNDISFEIVVLTDSFGPTLENKSINALAVTDETTPGATKINEVREKMHLKELPVHVCNLLTASDGQPVASQRIRSGEISRDGVAYSHVFATNKSLTLNTEARQFFSKKHGQLIKSEMKKQSSVVCIVGDSSLEFFRARYLPYNLGIYDLKQQRKDYTSPHLESITPSATIDNPPGEITPELSQKIKELVPKIQNSKKNYAYHILVNGEEDLAAPILVLLLPLQSLIYYGQPNEGIVEMEVTEKLKDQVYQILV